jgi:FlaA1/EpsC-like NDP-sugar epimerase
MRLGFLNRNVTTDEVIYENFEHVLEFRIGDVRDYAAVSRAVRDVDIVVNAAALKQVPTCEYFPDEALLTNCFGPINIVRAITEQQSRVEIVVGISTDKACKPVNVMGMTKALQERILVAANVLTTGTRFVAVRYGNVLASRGSVIPVFQDQILSGGPVKVTTADMTRFMTTLDQAVDTVFAALRDARPGETFVPVCPSSMVLDVARALVGERDIPIIFTGARPGEKVHEVLISEEEIRHTRRAGDFLAIQPMLPELADDHPNEPVELEREYSSANHLLDLDGTTNLLRLHHVLSHEGSSRQGRII